MDVKQITFQELDKIPAGAEFTTINLTKTVSRLSGKKPFPDTILRYIREYRETRRKVLNIAKRKSIYKMME